MQRKDKAKVIDEVWTPERVASFLLLQAPEGVNVDFHRLQRAYQSMRVEDFGDFVALFVNAGGQLDAPGPQQQTLLQELRRHRHGAEFAQVLLEHGARHN